MDVRRSIPVKPQDVKNDPGQICEIETDQDHRVALDMMLPRIWKYTMNQNTTNQEKGKIVICQNNSKWYKQNPGFSSSLSISIAIKFL